MQDDIASDKMDIELKTGYDIDESVIGVPGLIERHRWFDSEILWLMTDS